MDLRIRELERQLAADPSDICTAHQLIARYQSLLGLKSRQEEVIIPAQIEQLRTNHWKWETYENAVVIDDSELEKWIREALARLVQGDQASIPWNKSLDTEYCQHRSYSTRSGDTLLHGHAYRLLDGADFPPNLGIEPGNWYVEFIIAKEKRIKWGIKVASNIEVSND